MRRKRPSSGEAKSERRASFASHLPAPLQPDLDRSRDAFSTRYRPNSVFLAHLLATRDDEPMILNPLPSPAHDGASSYRATAALPRRRTAGHLVSTER